jgi:glycosyltransferase involved in cell wall biosynthesis
MIKLSVILITYNAAAHLEKSLASVTWADEIIVLDSGSSDATLEICRKYTKKVYLSEDWQGFGVQKNRVLGYAQGEWVLSLDADEVISERLQSEIQMAIQQTEFTAFKIPRLSQLMGRWIRHSGWQPDYVTRLFRRECAQFSNDLVHEKLEVLHGKLGILGAPILHYAYDSIEQLLEKTNRYSTESAKMHSARGRRGSLRQAIIHGVWAFLRTYVLRRGFLDGREGFLIAVAQAEVAFYRYVKLSYLQNNQLDKNLPSDKNLTDS